MNYWLKRKQDRELTYFKSNLLTACNFPKTICYTDSYGTKSWYLNRIKRVEEKLNNNSD